MSEQAGTQILIQNYAWTPNATMATIKHLPARPSTSSGLLWKRRRNGSNNNYNNNASITVHRQGLLTSRLYKQERLEALNLRRSNTSMLPRMTSAIQRPSLTSTANTTSHTTNSASSGKKSGSASDSGAQSELATAVGPQSEDSNESDILLTEEELERRRNVEKCLTWVQSLPAKFSGMHIVQQTVFADES